MTKTSPTQRSLALLRKNGTPAVVVERWNSFAKVRQDLFGFVDIVALADGYTIGVQTTTAANMTARLNKILKSEMFPFVCNAGWKIIIHGWHKDKNNKWQVKIITI